MIPTEEALAARMAARKPGLFGAIRLFERLAWLRRRRGAMLAPKALGGDALPREEPVRLTASLRPSLPAGEIEAIEPPTDEHPPRLTTTAFGLTGPGGVMPAHLAELALARRRGRDATLAHFFDLLNHRVISLFYRSWVKYRPPRQAEAASVPMGDDVSVALEALSGISGESARLGVAGLRPSLRDFAPLLSRRARAPGALTSALSTLLGQTVALRPFRLRWLPIDPAEQTRLQAYSGYNRLGGDAVLGSAVLDAQSRVEFEVGPLGWQAYRDMTGPHGPLSLACSLARLALGPARTIGFRVILKRTEIPAPRLCGADDMRLGYDFWLGVQPHATDRADVLLQASDLQGDPTRPARVASP